MSEDIFSIGDQFISGSNTDRVFELREAGGSLGKIGLFDTETGKAYGYYKKVENINKITRFAIDSLTDNDRMNCVVMSKNTDVGEIVKELDLLEAKSALFDEMVRALEELVTMNKKLECHDLDCATQSSGVCDMMDSMGCTCIVSKAGNILDKARKL